ncbi:hypothetical protein BDZ89DRAFT_409324 [Hymenopellis radicata]|nr:hypothetical protein BDZ89DRAFT_409324 [Hymenopellis radicata]
MSTRFLKLLPRKPFQPYLVCTSIRSFRFFGASSSPSSVEVLVFLSSCKQVRFVYETFCKMQSGHFVNPFTWKAETVARLTMYTKFTTSKHSVLLATTLLLVSGFPFVDRVLQVDAPKMPIRTSIAFAEMRGTRAKQGLLFLMLEEEGMVAADSRAATVDVGLTAMRGDQDRDYDRVTVVYFRCFLAATTVRLRRTPRDVLSHHSQRSPSTLSR